MARVLTKLSFALLTVTFAIFTTCLLRIVSGKKWLHPITRLTTNDDKIVPNFVFLTAGTNSGKYKPRKRNLRTKRLLRKLGASFDTEWMSIEKPSQNSSYLDISHDKKLAPMVRRLNFSFIDEQFKAFQFQNDLHGIFEEWLLQQASCPVEFRWTDLGTFFWPRWVKTGQCVINNSCSWPPGMKCAPVKRKLIHLLQWYCRKRQVRHPKIKMTTKRDLRRQERRKTRKNARKNQRSRDSIGIFIKRQMAKHSSASVPVLPSDKRKRKRNRNVNCDWMKVPYPIIRSCECSCEQN